MSFFIIVSNNYILSRTISKLLRSIGRILAFDGVPDVFKALILSHSVNIVINHVL